MMSLDTIVERNRSAAAVAAKEHKLPLTLEAHDLTSVADFASWGRKVPDLGTLVPKGWARVDMREWFGGAHPPHGIHYGDADGAGAFFVDASGMGQHGEPALTIDELMSVMRPGVGYAIVEAGQFQVKIGAFKRTH